MKIDKTQPRPSSPPRTSVVNKEETANSQTKTPISPLRILLVLLGSTIPSIILFILILKPPTYWEPLSFLAYIAVGFFLTPIVIILSIGSYYLFKRLLKVPKLNPLFLLIPIILSIVSANWMFIYVYISGTLYRAHYSLFNPQVKLIEESISEEENPFIAKYFYAINLYNPDKKTYTGTPLVVNLEYLEKTTQSSRDLGVDTSDISIKSGDNLIRGSILLSANNFPEYKLNGKLALKISYTLPNPPKDVVIPTEEQIDIGLQNILNNLKKEQDVISSTALPEGNPEVILSSNPPSGWKEYKGLAFSLFYPPEWEVEVLPRSVDSPDSVLFFTASRLSQPLRYTKLSTTTLERLKFWKEVDMGDKKEDSVAIPLQINGKRGIKISYPLTSTQVTILLENNGSVYEIVGDVNSALSQILSTLKFH